MPSPSGHNTEPDIISLDFSSLYHVAFVISFHLDPLRTPSEALMVAHKSAMLQVEHLYHEVAFERDLWDEITKDVDSLLPLTPHSEGISELRTLFVSAIPSLLALTPFYLPKEQAIFRLKVEETIQKQVNDTIIAYAIKQMPKLKYRCTLLMTIYLQLLSHSCSDTTTYNALKEAATSTAQLVADSLNVHLALPSSLVSSSSLSPTNQRFPSGASSDPPTMFSSSVDGSFPSIPTKGSLSGNTLNDVPSLLVADLVELWGGKEGLDRKPDGTRSPDQLWEGHSAKEFNETLLRGFLTDLLQCSALLKRFRPNLGIRQMGHLLSQEAQPPQEDAQKCLQRPLKLLEMSLGRNVSGVGLKRPEIPLMAPNGPPLARLGRRSDSGPGALSSLRSNRGDPEESDASDTERKVPPRLPVDVVPRLNLAMINPSAAMPSSRINEESISLYSSCSQTPSDDSNRETTSYSCSGSTHHTTPPTMTAPLQGPGSGGPRIPRLALADLSRCSRLDSGRMSNRAPRGGTNPEGHFTDRSSIRFGGLSSRPLALSTGSSTTHNYSNSRLSLSQRTNASLRHGTMMGIQQEGSVSESLIRKHLVEATRSMHSMESEIHGLREMNDRLFDLLRHQDAMIRTLFERLEKV